MPVVYASGRYSRATEEQSVGGARFLAKPFVPTLAGSVIRNLIEAHTPSHRVPVRDAAHRPA
jgi:hypothetical protein